MNIVNCDLKVNLIHLPVFLNLRIINSHLVKNETIEKRVCVPIEAYTV